MSTLLAAGMVVVIVMPGMMVKAVAGVTVSVALL
jgi:hypothetical protein